MRSDSVWFGSLLAFLLLITFVASSSADTAKFATFDCDGGPDAGGFRMDATYYFPPGGKTPNRAAVTMDGTTTELTQRDHDDASGWTFYSAAPVISFYWVGPTAALYVGSKASKCVERPAQPAAQAQGGRTAELADAKAPVPIPSADLNWTELDPAGAPGVKIAVLWGDFQTSGFGAFFNLPAGFTAPLHTHTHDMKLVIVSGTYIQGPDGAQEFRLGPGSYLLQPGGDYRHTTSCDQASDCLFFVESDGAFDLHPATP